MHDNFFIQTLEESIDNNKQLNIFDTSNQILDLPPQPQSLALSSTQNINFAVGTLDTTREKTNVTCPSRNIFDWNDNATAQGLSHSSMN